MPASSSIVLFEKAVLDNEIIHDNSAAHIAFAEDLPERHAII